MTSLLETLVSPTSGGTKSCKGITSGVLQGWQSDGLKKADIVLREGMSVPRMPQT